MPLRARAKVEKGFSGALHACRRGTPKGVAAEWRNGKAEQKREGACGTHWLEFGYGNRLLDSHAAPVLRGPYLELLIFGLRFLSCVFEP